MAARAPLVVEVPVHDPSALSARRWSASSVESFRGCPLRYWWEKVEGWRGPSTVPLAVGRAVHAALEDLLSLPPEGRSPDRAREFLEAAIEREAAEPGLDASAVAEGARTAMDAYWSTEDPTAIDVVGVEHELDTELRGLPFGGYVDLISEVDVGRRVTDYKTGAPKPRYWWGYWRQQYLYAAALGDVAEVELLYLTRPRSVRRPVYPAAMARALGELEQAHEERAAMAEASAYEARPGPLCSWCDFRVACPAQRKDAPPPGSAASDERLESAGLTRR